MCTKRTDDRLRNPAQEGRSIDDKRDAAVKTRKLVVNFHGSFSPIDAKPSSRNVQRREAAISELHEEHKGNHPVIVNLRATSNRDIAVHYQAREIVDVFIYPEEMIQELLHARAIVRNA